MYRRFIMAAASGAVLLTLTAGSALAGGTAVSTLDQSQTKTATSWTAGASVDDPQILMQTFTASLTGPLDKISLDLTATADDGALPGGNGAQPADEPWGTVKFMLDETDGTFPNSEILDGTFVAATGWNTISFVDFDEPPSVTAGNVYAIMLMGRTTPGVTWNGTCSAGAYTRGLAYSYSDGDFKPLSVDGCSAAFAFRTYVIAVPADPTAPPISPKTPPTTATASNTGSDGGGDPLYLLICGLAAAAVCVPLANRRLARR